jgi:hypothetical protein
VVRGAVGYSPRAVDVSRRKVSCGQCSDRIRDLQTIMLLRSANLHNNVDAV